jgi:lysozyme
VSFTFNVGAAAFKGSTLLRLLNAGKTAEAGEQFARWTKAAGRELPGLVKRRRSENELFKSGKLLLL